MYTILSNATFRDRGGAVLILSRDSYGAVGGQDRH
jgi:hypothetical protein